jgi:fatty-acyl-CoA synthase
MALQSYANGSGDSPLLGVTVGQLLDEAACRWPDQEALIVVDQGVRWEWRELRERARTFAAGLLALGLEPGDRVGMLATNRAEWVVTQFATAYAGLVLVNINPAYRTPELEYALKKVGCRGLITESAFKTSNYLAMMNELAPELASADPGDLRAPRLPDLRFVIRLGEERSPGMLNFSDVTALPGESDFARLDAIGTSLDFDAPINIQFTSGTTGSPKAATLTHHNIVNNATMSSRIMNFTESDRLCMPVPMYHCFGMVLGTLLCTASGAAIVLPSAGFEAQACLRAIDQERCTAVHGVPTMFIAMLDDPDFDKYDTTSLRTGIMAGAPCPIELMHRVIDDMHMSEITIGYGMTETGPLGTQTLPDGSFHAANPANCARAAIASCAVTGAIPSARRRRSTTRAGYARVTRRRWTRTATCVSSAAARTCLSAVVRTSIRARSRNFYIHIRRSSRPRLSACPT